ncbi:MAG: adenosine deaminase [Ignavibacteriales bacterium]|nr:adenosine deaminase [Ignavibacteriales bacterium]
MGGQIIPEVIRKMPKVEIHLHLEGAFTFEFLFGLIQKYGGDKEIKNLQDLRNKFVFKDFAHFIETWFWKNKYFKTAEDFEESTYQTIKNLSHQNVIYAEVFFSPWDFASSGLKLEAIAEATISGIKRAEKDFPIKCNLIADIVRDHGAETSLQRLNQITPFLGKGIVGIGLGGNEKAFPPILFKDVFLEAKNRGFRTTVHAGEAAGPESIWSALLDLKAERIGHGVRAEEDPKLIDYIIENQVPLEMCITSNLQTKVVPSLKDHPFDALFRSGAKVTLNSDDPPMFGADITDELFLLYNKLNYSLEDLLLLTKNAVEVSFLSNSEKQKYYLAIDDYSATLK